MLFGAGQEACVGFVQLPAASGNESVESRNSESKQSRKAVPDIFVADPLVFDLDVTLRGQLDCEWCDRLSVSM